jgi:hypothetical protein
VIASIESGELSSAVGPGRAVHAGDRRRDADPAPLGIAADRDRPRPRRCQPTITNPGELEHVRQRLSSATTDPAALRRIGAAGFFGYCLDALVTTALPVWLLYRRRA